MNTKILSRSILGFLACVALFFAFSASNEPVIGFLRGSSVEHKLHALHYENAIVFNFAIAYLVSLMFWVLIVYIPDRQVRRILKNNLSLRYQAFKEDTIDILVLGCKDTEGMQLSRVLSHHITFREFFNASNKYRWYEVMNYLEANPQKLDDVRNQLQFLVDEIAYVLSKVNFDEPHVHAFFRWLCVQVNRLKQDSNYSHEQVKYYGRFLWKIFTGWDRVDGYSAEDVIKKMIFKI